MEQEFQISDRVQTEIGTTGEIVAPDFDMPNHHLVQLDTGHKIFILRRILKPAIEPVAKVRSKKKSPKSEKI